MAKRFFSLLFLFSTHVFSLNITVSLGEDGNTTYSLLEIDRKESFVCTHIEETHRRRDYILCEFGKVPLIKPEGTENRFFSISPYVKNHKLFIDISPKFKARLFSKMIGTLEDRYIYKKEIQRSNKWFIVGYRDTIPYLKEKERDGINFPIQINQWEYPTIGTLDIGGFPIRKHNSKDFIEYNALKRLFDRGDYRTLIARIDRKLRNKEINQLFMPEILAFKIKALNNQKEKNREIVETGAPWVKAYTSHKDLPKIMLIVAKSYQDMGIIKESNKLLDTLIKEYPNDSSAEMAMIYRGDKFAKEGKVLSSKKLYEKVLYNSDDIEVASIAAARLGKYYLLNEDVARASELYKKILKSNPKFFHKDLEKSFLLAKDLADRKVPEVASKLGETIYLATNSSNKEFRNIILSTARWYKKAKNYEKSMEFYKKFIEDFSFVKNIETIKKEVDYLKFEMDKGDYKERLAVYDYIIQKYSDEKISQEASYKKMMLYIEHGMFKAAKEYLPTFENLDSRLFFNLEEEVKRIARKIIKESLKKSECAMSVELIHRYKILLPDTFDESMYNCAMIRSDFDLAIDISNDYIDQLSSVDSLVWQKRELEALFRKSDYFEYVIKAKRVARIEKALDRVADKDLYFKLFESYVRLGRDEELIPTLNSMEKYFPKDPKILDLYKHVIESRLKDKEYSKVMEYSLKLLNAQRLLDISTFSPFVEFAISDSAKELKRYEQGILVLEDLTTLPYDDETLFQGLFKLGELYSLNSNEKKSIDTFKRCTQLDGNSTWKSLCSERVPK